MIHSMLYLSQPKSLLFELISNWIIDLPSHFLLISFISELKPYIRREVQGLQLINLMQQIGLAIIQEEKYMKIQNIKYLHIPLQIVIILLLPRLLLLFPNLYFLNL